MTEETPASPPDPDLDARQLRTLSRLHYALAVLTAMLCLPFLPLAAYGYPKVFPSEQQKRQWAQSDAAFQEAVFGAICFSSGVTLASLAIMHGGVVAYLGRCIARRERRKFCVVVTLFNLAYSPLGTLLGIFSLAVLSRDSVRATFSDGRAGLA